MTIPIGDEVYERFIEITDMTPDEFPDGYTWYFNELYNNRTVVYFSDMPGFPTEEQFRERFAKL